jgi:hypothetical protein
MHFMSLAAMFTINIQFKNEMTTKLMLASLEVTVRLCSTNQEDDNSKFPIMTLSPLLL